MRYLGPAILGFLLSFLLNSIARGQQYPQFDHRPTAPGHWYEWSCCSSRECERLPLDAVIETKTGWRVTYVSERFGPIDVEVPREKARPSRDADFHGCWFKIQKNPLQARCLYVPATS